MRNGRRFLSALLVFCMLIPFAVPAMAQDETQDYKWQAVQTCDDGLKAGDIYLSFNNNWCQGIVTPGNGYAGLHTAECMASGTWFVDAENGLVKGTYIAPAEYTSSGEDETVIFEPSENAMGCAYIFYYAIAEAGIEWLPVASTTEGLQNGDLYIDCEALADGYVDFVVSMMNSDGNPGNDITPEKAAEMRQGLKADDILTALYVNPNGTLNKYKAVIDTETIYCPLDNNQFNGNNLLAAMLGDVLPGCVKQYHAEPEISWIALPYDSEGLSEGDWYLDSKAFINIIGKGKSDDEKAAALEIIKQHVAFFFNPDGDEYVYKYVYTDLPLADGTTVSGSVILPLDLTENPEVAFPYDYNALTECVKIYTAPVEPEDDKPNSLQSFVIVLKSIIQTILSFFRKIFG